MMDIKEIDALTIPAVKRVKGIVDVCVLSPDDRQKIIEIERDVEERSLMGLGKVVNTGVTEVLKCDAIYVVLNNMDFDWGRYATLVLKKGQQVVGEEVRDKEVIARLSGRKDVWFLHKNFVVYKDKINFPQDIMKKICYFEIPCVPAEWCRVEGSELQSHSIIFAYPATPTDIFLKNQYFDGLDDRGLGTILVGVKL